MEAAARALDFEEAKRYRDKIGAMRGGASAEAADAADYTGLERQQPGRTGLGTSQYKFTPPPGWWPPPKPDPMTTGPGASAKKARNVGPALLDVLSPEHQFAPSVPTSASTCGRSLRDAMPTVIQPSTPVRRAIR